MQTLARLNRNWPTGLETDRLDAVLILVTAAAIGLSLSGLIPETPAAIAVLSVVLLLSGMPHGSFDLALLRAAGRSGTLGGSRIALVTLYLACAVVTYVLWQVAPVLSLAAFLILAAVHFADDWCACPSPFLARAIPVAALSAPALFHADALLGLFVTLTGQADAAILANLLLLIAPTMVALASVGSGLLWQSGEWSIAIRAGCGLIAMVVLPPVTGFALFFCLVHSPFQFRSHAAALNLRGVKQWGWIVAPIALGGIGVALAIFALDGRPALVESLFASSFIALSVLTVPHMLVPQVLHLLAKRPSA